MKLSESQKTSIEWFLLFLLLGLIFYLGYGIGSVKTCKSVDGFLDTKRVCHIGYDPNEQYTIQPNFDIWNVSVIVK